MRDTSLFKRLGGRDAVDAIVEGLYARTAADDRINGFFADVDADRHVWRLKLFFRYALGAGPEYAGKSLREAHDGLGLDDGHFDAFLEHVRATLGERAPGDLASEVMTLFEAMRGEVLGR